MDGSRSEDTAYDRGSNVWRTPRQKVEGEYPSQGRVVMSKEDILSIAGQIRAEAED